MQTVKLTFKGLQYPVAGRIDEIVSLRRHFNQPLDGGVLGMEFRKKLSWASARQTETEFLLFAPISWYPFCQVRNSNLGCVQAAPIAYWINDLTVRGNPFPGCH
jgi:hypothetical protein